MEQKFKRGEAVDLAILSRNFDGDYCLGRDSKVLDVIKDKELCDLKQEVWIKSVGRSKETGEIYASVTGKYYDNPAFECVWLR